MTPELAQAALQFMQRVQLQGQEVPAFNAVCAALREEVKPTQTGQSSEVERPSSITPA